MKVIGLTGSLGTGKTSVARWLKAKGAEVLDADRIVHELLERKGPYRKAVVNAFGEKILDEDGRVDRKALAQVAFQSQAARKRLERIVHPQVIQEMKKQVAALRRKANVPAVVLDVPLLFESGLDKLADVNVVVKTTQATQLARVSAQRNWTRVEALARIRAQWPLREKIRRADVVIDNNGDRGSTQRQVRRFWADHINNI